MKYWCPIISKNQSDEVLENAFPGMAYDACQNWNTLESRDGDQVIMDLNWQDFINTNGQSIYYYVYGFDLEKSDKLFGEDVLAEYKEPFQIKMYLEIKDVPKSLGPYGGFFSDDTITGYVHIKTFQTIAKTKEFYEELKLDLEPKPQDLIQIISYGCDRPGDRGANYYEITNKEDQLFSANINPSYGHYVWKIFAKRFMFSHETGAIDPYGETGNCQTYDNRLEGIFNPDENIATAYQDKKYDFDIDKEGKEKIFDQSRDNQDDVYGGYYQ